MRAYRVATVRALACPRAVRIALVFLLAACAPPPNPPPLEARAPEVDEPCDLAAWQDRAASPLRGRIAGTEVIVLSDGHGRSQVLAWRGRSVLVGGDFPDDRFDRVVTQRPGL